MKTFAGIWVLVGLVAAALLAGCDGQHVKWVDVERLDDACSASGGVYSIWTAGLLLRAMCRGGVVVELAPTESGKVP